VLADRAQYCVYADSPRGTWRGFAKAVLARLTEEVNVSALGHASREQRLGLHAVTRAAALTESLAVDDLVDVPDAAAEEKSRRSSLCPRHDSPGSALLGSDDRILWSAGKTFISIAKALMWRLELFASNCSAVSVDR
jgi:hypothetical protein